MLVRDGGDEPGFGCVPRQQQAGGPAMAGKFARDGEEPVAEAFCIPEPCAVAGRDRGELKPGEQVGGQRGDMGPGLVRAGGEEWQFPESGVLERFNPVLTPCPGPVPDVQGRPVPARGVRQERGDPVPILIKKAFSIATDMDVYFCDPGSPWQRGSNENTNGLLRQYFPKGTDLNAYGPEDLEHVAQELNARPRKTLDWKTSAESLRDLLIAS